MMPRDMRIHGVNGRYETKFVVVDTDMNALADTIPGNGSRVALILAAQPDVPVAGDHVLVGVRAPGTAVRAIVTLTADHPNALIELGAFGDIAILPLTTLSAQGFVGVHVYEVVWHPDPV